MAKDKRTLQECIAMGADLAEAMGLKWVNAHTPEGLSYEDHSPGAPHPRTFLLIKVGEKGRVSYPFGNAGMPYAEFWQAGDLALNCLDLVKEELQRKLEEVRVEAMREIQRVAGIAAASKSDNPVVYRPDLDDMTPEAFIQAYGTLKFHPQCSHDCSIKRNHATLCHLCRPLNEGE